MARGIYPVVAVVGAQGVRLLSDDDTSTYVRTMVDARMTRPDGPLAGSAGSPA
jgi:hypothetical protein